MRLKHLALGQGMGARAAEAVEAGAARGLWVLLQNCHLLPRWLPALDALLERLDRPHKACCITAVVDEILCYRLVCREHEWQSLMIC